MADEQAATPAPGTAPVVRDVSGQRAIVDRIAAKLERQMARPDSAGGDTSRATPEGASPKAEGEKAVTEPSPEASEDKPEKELAEAGAEPETPSEAEDEAEEGAEKAGETEGEKLAATLDALAEAVGTDVDTLLEQLNVPIKVQGKDQTVTLGEALKGYQREADYSLKTAELGAKERKFSEDLQAAQTQLAQKFQTASDLVSVLEYNISGDPRFSDANLAQLRDTDFGEYVRLKDERDGRLTALMRAKGALQQVREERQLADRQKFTQWRATEQTSLLRRIPELGDKSKLAKFEEGVKTYLTKSAGFNEKDVAQFMGTFDHRHVLIVRDAMRYRDMVAKGETAKEKIKKLPKKFHAGPSSGVGEAAKQKLEVSREKLKRSGSVKDLAAHLKLRGFR